MSPNNGQTPEAMMGTKDSDWVTRKIADLKFPTHTDYVAIVETVEFKTLEASIRTHGIQKPIIVRGNQIISGGRRTLVLQRLGNKTIRCLSEDL